MKKSQRWLYSLACLFSVISSFAVGSSAGTDAPISEKLTTSTVKKSGIPISVLKDIRRVHPGMTRADLDWLFIPDGGFYTETPRSYIYRYAGASLAAIDTAGKPLLDKATHRPVAYGQAVKIDVSFRPATGRGWTTLTEDGTSHQIIDPNGRWDDVVVSISDPYVGFENDD